MINQGIFIIISSLFFYFIFFKRFFTFGFKESFCVGLFFYIYLPLFFVYFYNELLINTFKNFYGYEFIDILGIQYLTITLISSFILGYISLNKKVNLFNFRQNYSNKNIFLTIFVLLILFFFEIPHINNVILISILCNLLIYNTKLKLFIKTLFFLLLCLVFMYFSLEFSDARRHIIVILFISVFFISLIHESKIKVYFIFILLAIAGILFVFLLTNLRSILITGDNSSYNLLPTLDAFISNYDFMPAFDNLLTIFNTGEYLYGKTLFKLFFTFIPREIWPTKPIDANLLIIELRESNFIFVGGTSQSVTLLGEVFWNFGWVGTFIVFYIFGLFAKNFDLCFKNKIYDNQIILMAFFTYLIFILWRGSISTTLVIFFLNVFLLFTLLNISKLFFRSEKKIINK